jgi:AcrR family transcriptional regulator
MPNPQRRTQQERRSESDRRMIEAAIELFASRGYTKTTLVQIGQAAGCTGTLVSNRFGSKEGILRAVLAHIMSRFATDHMLAERIEAVFVGPPRPPQERKAVRHATTGTATIEKNPPSSAGEMKNSTCASAEFQMRDFVHTYLEDVIKSPSRIRALHVIMGEALGAVQEVRTEVAKVNKLFRAKITQLIEGGIATGEYRADLDKNAASIVIVGLLRGVTTQGLVERNTVQLELLIPFAQDAVMACLMKPDVSP